MQPALARITAAVATAGCAQPMLLCPARLTPAELEGQVFDAAVLDGGRIAVDGGLQGRRCTGASKLIGRCMLLLRIPCTLHALACSPTRRIHSRSTAGAGRWAAAGRCRSSRHRRRSLGKGTAGGRCWGTSLRGCQSPRRCGRLQAAGDGDRLARHSALELGLPSSHADGGTTWQSQLAAWMQGASRSPRSGEILVSRQGVKTHRGRHPASPRWPAAR